MAPALISASLLSEFVRTGALRSLQLNPDFPAVERNSEVFGQLFKVKKQMLNELRSRRQYFFTNEQEFVRGPGLPAAYNLISLLLQRMSDAVEVLLKIRIESERERTFLEPISHEVLQNIQGGVTGLFFE